MPLIDGVGMAGSRLTVPESDFLLSVVFAKPINKDGVKDEKEMVNCPRDSYLG
jgi:hypothetical protein